MQKITPFLWFDDNAEEAANYYVSVFPNSKIKNISRYGDSGPRPKGSVMTVAFQLDGQEFVGLNGGPTFKLTEAVSFVVNCRSQAEVDHYWEKLCDGGQEIQCGWLKDKFGLCWQVVPTEAFDMINDKDPQKVNRMMAAMMTMIKLDLAALRAAFEGN